MSSENKAEERIKELEEELRTTKYNKRTQHSIGLLKAKIARLKTREEVKSSKKSSGKGYSVKKSGDATAILIGFPSVGKSTLLNNLTNAESSIGYYDFTTLEAIPGMLNYKGAQIQIIDIPGIIEGASQGKGFGKKVLSCLLNADLILILIDSKKPEQLEKIKKELYNFRIRLNRTPPRIKISKKTKGGIHVMSSKKLTKTSKPGIANILREFNINNADVVIYEDITYDDLIDTIEANRKYVPSSTIINKIDLINIKNIQKIISQTKANLAISATNQTNIEELKKLIFTKLNLMRVYCKEQGKKADLKEPVILRKGDTIKRLAEKIHKDLVTKFEYAKLWGESAKFEGQKIADINHELNDKDIVEIHFD